jgi:uncharacterized peroxidase-related enzyme
VEHHRAGLARLTRGTRREGVADAIVENWRTADLRPRERAMLAYALALNDDPGAMREEYLRPLRAAGLRDRDILHLNLVVGYFAFANRLTLGLGVELEPSEEHPPGA